MAPGDGFRPGGKLLDQLKAEAGSLASAARDRAVLSVRQNLGDAASRLARYAESGGGPGLMAAVTGVRAPAGGRSSPRSGTAMRGAARRRAGGSSGPGGRHKGGQARKSPGRRRDAGHSRTTTDHEEIRRWVREHGGRPASVKGTERRGEQAGILRVNFPGSPADESFKMIGWGTFFDKFEASPARVHLPRRNRGRPAEPVRQIHQPLEAALSQQAGIYAYGRRARQALASCRLASRLGLHGGFNAQAEGCVSRRDLS